MSVPKKIREVDRPTNTIVEDYGREGPCRYAVRERSGEKYIRNGNPQSHNGRVIGHIIDGRYVPKKQIEDAKCVQSIPLSYGSTALVRSVSEDIRDDLHCVFQPDETYMLMTLATLRVIKPNITARRTACQYKTSYTSVYYPGVHLSENTIGSFLEKIGKDFERRKQFYLLRIKSLEEKSHVAVDGMLKQDTSEVNDLSAYSYKSRVRGCKEISILYTYNIEKMEPICAEVFPGNSIDASSYSAFIRNNNIQRGIIVADKGFPPSKIQKELDANAELHFLAPLKRSDIRIKDNNMTDFEGILEGVEGQVMYKKKKIKGGRYLYSFMDTHTASAEREDYLQRAKKKASFNKEEYEKKKPVFGVIVFESDQDIDPCAAYRCYKDRWLLELVFRRYKNDIERNTTRVQTDFSVIGSEFVNFIATVITCRIIKKMESIPSLHKISFGDLMEDLSTAWRKTGGTEKPVSNDNQWVHTLAFVFDELEALGLSEKATKPEEIEKNCSCKKSQKTEPRRPRGRPRKAECSQAAEGV